MFPQNNFERGIKDEFEVSGTDVGEIQKIVIGHDNSGACACLRVIARAGAQMGSWCLAQVQTAPEHSTSPSPPYHTR